MRPVVFQLLGSLVVSLIVFGPPFLLTILSGIALRNWTEMMRWPEGTRILFAVGLFFTLTFVWGVVIVSLGKRRRRLRERARSFDVPGES